METHADEEMASDLESDNVTQVGRSYSLAEATKGSGSAAVPVSGFINALAGLETKITHATRSTSAPLNLFSAAPPKAVSLEEDEALTYENLLTELRSVRQKLSLSHQALMDVLGQLNAANAHCTVIHRELGCVREQIVNATRAKERGSKKVRARFATSRTLRSEFDQAEAERQERERAASEKQKQKEVADALLAHQIADDAMNRNFTGRLAAYKKDDLRALAIAIGASEKGTNAELMARILDHFEQNPDMKHNSRFSGLFSKRGAQKKSTAVPSGEEGWRQEQSEEIGHPELLHVASNFAVASSSSSANTTPYIFSSQPYYYYNTFQ